MVKDQGAGVLTRREAVEVDIATMEGIIRLLISGTESIGEALQLALLQYQDRAGCQDGGAVD